MSTQQARVQQVITSTGTITTATGTSGFVQNLGAGTITAGIGLYGYTNNDTTGTIGLAYGSYSQARNSGAGTITTARGGYNVVNNIGTGIITTAQGTSSLIQNTSTGTITTAQGLTSNLVNDAGGTVTNWRGLFITDEGTDPNYYSIYTDGTTKSYFGGPVGFGDTSPDQGGAQPLVVDAEGAIGATHYCDEAGNNCFPPATIAGGLTALSDTDNDTLIQVEEATDEDKIRFDTAGAERMIIDEIGRVAIGSSSPATDLYVYDASGHSEIRIESSAAGGSTVPALSIKNPSTEWSFGLTDGTGLNIRENSASYTSRMFIENGGNVGIGTTVPDEVLDVSGRIRIDMDGVAGDPFINFIPDSGQANSWMMGVDDNGNKLSLSYGLSSSNTPFGTTADMMTLDPSGNVGIGTSAPNWPITTYGSTSSYHQFANATTGVTAADGALL